jgi:hypothetical protein
MSILNNELITFIFEIKLSISKEHTRNDNSSKYNLNDGPIIKLYVVWKQTITTS